MAQIQTARFPMNGPSWDEEVVPALRKRLESESRTLAKRMSAVSLASQDDHFISMHADSMAATAYVISRDNNPTSPFLQSNASASARTQYPQPIPPTFQDRIPTKSNSRPIPNGNSVDSSKRKLSSPSPAATSTFQRSRTYSQPYLSEINGHTSRPKTNGSSQGNIKSSRSPEIRPTRIPQPASRSPPLVQSANGSIPGHVSPPPIPNGYHQYTTSPTTPTQPVSTTVYPENGQRTPIAAARTTPNVNVNMNVGLGLMNEPPPFNPASASSSITPSLRSASPEPRPSTESDERPFEHWYRGEVSRNGGVGELRVGRRQEMLEIANYGHTIRARERQLREDGRKRRKRADSVSGIGDGSRERGSLYLDDEDARRVGQVLDEAPLTDLDGSEGGYHEDEVYGYGGLSDDEGERTWRQEDADTFAEEQSRAVLNGGTSPLEVASRTSHDTRSTTPTPATIQAPRPDSRNTSVQPSRIPARSRQSSESRVMTPTQFRATSESPSTPSSSHSHSRQRQQQPSKGTPGGRATSKSRTGAAKTRAKLMVSKEVEEDAKRRSVAHYPTPGEEGDETMIDAIPEWTQPVPRQGNWDDVVLPVVARKKGLDEHYQKADGNTTPRKVDNTPAPAPGTFGYDRSKYRRPRADGEPELIPMDEFGAPIPQEPESPPEDEKSPPSIPNKPNVNSHDQTRLPTRTAPSPAPFADYAPMRGAKPTVLTTAELEPRVTVKHQLPEDDGGSGCCKCVIM